MSGQIDDAASPHAMGAPAAIVDAHHHFWDLDEGRYPWLQDAHEGDAFFLGPWMVGVSGEPRGGSGASMLCLSGALVLGASLVLLIPARLVESAQAGRQP